MDNTKKDEPQDEKQDELAESLDDLFCSISTMIKSELQVKLQILSSFPLTSYFYMFNEHLVNGNVALFEKLIVIFIYLFCYNVMRFCVRGQIIT